MATKYSIYDFITEQLPNVTGYGNFKKKLDEDGISDHSVFYQTIRNDHEGDVGIFVLNTKDNTDMKFAPLTESEIQIVVNCVGGDILQGLDYLQSLYDVLHKTKGNSKIKVFNCKKINLRPVGKNTNDICWCVLNILIKYR